MATILDKIVAHKRVEIAAAKTRVPLAQLKNQVAQAPPVRDFLAPLAADGPIQLIAEVKQASPSKGVIRENFDPVAIARTYAQCGAACISVLTDEHFFQGSLAYLTAIREAVDVPLLRKDFILDPYQVFEARWAGADAVLLIAECLDDDALGQLYQQIIDLEMTPLVEIYEPANLPRVLQLGAPLIGVNNRDLRDFSVDLHHTIYLKQRMPQETVVVGESAIFTREDALLLQEAGVKAMLVGESLLRQENLASAVTELIGC